MRQERAQTLFSYPTEVASKTEGTRMLTTGGTDFKAHSAIMAVMTALLAVAATLPGQWRVSAERVWSYAVYSVGYRLLSVHLSCGSLAVSGIPFVMKHA
jgi:hypothetical protein